MPDPIPTPGVRVGQVWERVKKQHGRYVRISVTRLGMGDVYANVLDDDGEPIVYNCNLPRSTFEQRYRLVSEGGAPDA